MKILDIEVYPNYAMFAFLDVETRKVTIIDELKPKKMRKLKRILTSDTIITFNGMDYDMPMTQFAVAGATNEMMYNLSKRIVEGNRMKGWMIMRDFRIPELEIDHIDIKEPAPGVMVSLKLYGTRIGSRKLWDLPFDPHEPLDKNQIKTLKEYCGNDLAVTEDLYNAIRDRIELRETMRERYGLDVRSKSDAQIAEAVIISELGGKYSAPKLPSTYKIRYVAPDYVKFKSKQLQDVLRMVQEIDFTLDKNGSPVMPDVLGKLEIEIGETKYNMGMGGLHSMEKQLVKVSDDKNVMCNADFDSYYPFIIIRNKYFPKHLGRRFLDIYTDIVNTRLAAKRSGDKLTADSLKITINGSFGKYGSKYSKLYSPDLLLQVTLTGQLTLLMIIERFEAKGIPVVSSNTDGLEYFCPRKKLEKAAKIIKKIEKKTGYTMELGQYKALYARDVNNYVAVYDGYTKSKGVYADLLKTPGKGLDKNRQTPICFTAVREFLLSEGKTSIEKTIRSCADMNEFVAARTVKGGAIYGMPQYGPRTKGQTSTGRTKYYNPFLGYDEEVYLGKVARWYYAHGGKQIHYKTSNNLVPLTEGAKPMMDLTEEIPDDLNYEWYIEYAQRMLDDLGYKSTKEK